MTSLWNCGDDEDGVEVAEGGAIMGTACTVWTGVWAVDGASVEVVAVRALDVLVAIVSDRASDCASAVLVSRGLSAAPSPR